jgi:septum formation protein
MLESIVLASGSPRRQEYFRLLGLPFSSMPAGIAEIPVEGRSPRETAEDFAVRKTRTAAGLLKDRQPLWVCGADTVISLDGAVLGKPSGREHAKEMLLHLAGREHEVITAVALYNGRRKSMDCRSAVSAVSFAALSDAEIEWYLDTGEWRGVAGAYRIQGLAGCFIRSSTGSPGAVAGLPLRDFYVMLRENGYPFGARDRD